MDLTQFGAQLLKDKLGLDVDPATIQSAISSLMGDGKGGLDLQGLVSNLAQSGDLGTLVSSWLGDGGNLPISAGSITDLFGQAKVDQFAETLGVDAGQAAGGLADVLPQMIDKASSGGNLLEGAGGLGGLMGTARSFLS